MKQHINSTDFNETNRKFNIFLVRKRVILTRDSRWAMGSGSDQRAWGRPRSTESLGPGEGAEPMGLDGSGPKGTEGIR